LAARGRGGMVNSQVVEIKAVIVQTREFEQSWAHRQSKQSYLAPSYTN